MSSYLAPGIYVEEVAGGSRPIQAVGTSTAAFVGAAPKLNARLNEAVPINNWSQFAQIFTTKESTSTPLACAVAGFFVNGGSRCFIVNVGTGPLTGKGDKRAGIDLLEHIDEIAIVAAPGRTSVADYDTVIAHCEKMKDRVGILDAPETVEDISALTIVAVEQRDASGENTEQPSESPPTQHGLRPRSSEGGYAAFYFPWLQIRDPLSGQTVNAPPSGHLAGIWARSDATRGVHKAPANEPIRGALNLTYHVTPSEQGALNSNGVNCIRYFKQQGILVWGARTIANASSEWRYLNVRRLVNMIEESIASSTRWIVFEPNDEPLWKAIQRDVSAFLTTLWREGALMGGTPDEAFFVKCDAETNPPESIDAGRVMTLIGISPVKPAEFIIFRLSQFSGGSEIES